jgi:antitoxin FitA
MATLQVKNVPDDVHAALRQRADREGTTLSELVIRMLRRELALPSMAEWLGDVSRRPAQDRDIDIESLLDAVRDEP